MSDDVTRARWRENIRRAADADARMVAGNPYEWYDAVIDAALAASDAAWRQRIADAVAELRTLHNANCPRHSEPRHNCLCGATSANAALDALAARLLTTEARND